MNQKIIDINQKVYRDIKAFLQDKEMHVNSRVNSFYQILAEKNLTYRGIDNA